MPVSDTLTCIVIPSELGVRELTRHTISPLLGELDCVADEYYHNFDANRPRYPDPRAARSRPAVQQSDFLLLCASKTVLDESLDLSAGRTRRRARKLSRFHFGESRMSLMMTPALESAELPTSSSIALNFRGDLLTAEPLRSFRSPASAGSESHGSCCRIRSLPGWRLPRAALR